MKHEIVITAQGHKGTLERLQNEFSAIRLWEAPERDAALKAPRPMPVTLIVSRPDGVEHRRLQIEDQGFGGRSVSLALSSTVQTGTWRARVHADPKAAAIGEVSFLVEDFVPERLDLKLEPPTAALAPGETQTIKAFGRYLYGPPADNLAIEGDIVVKPSNAGVEGFTDYQFGQADESIEPVRKSLDLAAVTDAKGNADIAVSLPQVPHTARPLEANVNLRLRETGGRTIERNVTIPVDLKEPRIGIKSLFDGKDLDVIGVIGIVLLIGIVKKNAIMIVDFALEAEREHGK